MDTQPSRSTIVILKLVAATVLALLVWLLSEVLLMIFAAILFAIAYRGCAEWISRRTRISVKLALVCVAFGVTAGIGGLVWWSGGTLAAQFVQLWEQLQARFTDLTNVLQDSGWGEWITDNLGGERLLTGVQTLAGRFAGAALGTLGVVGAIIIVVVTGIYLAISPDLYFRGFVRLLAVEYRPRGAEVLGEIGAALRLWLVGRAIDMIVVIIVTFIGLNLLGVPLPLALALIAGVLNFIPYIGAVLGAIPATLVAFGQDPIQALWVVLLFGGIQSLEGYLLEPYIERQTVALPPALTILSQTVFGTLFGILGLLLAPALMVVIMVVVQTVYIHDVLGDRDMVRRRADR